MIIELKTARYKGVEFLYQEMSTVGGNRLIKYNYPGSDKQSIERQGKVPRSFTMTIIIAHEDYYQQRDNILRVLEDGQPGVLTHPTFGDVENVISGKFTLTEKLTELGRGEISVNFEVDNSPGVPQQSGNLTSQVLALNEQLSDQMIADLEDGYSVGLNFFGNFTDALENVNNIADSMNNIAGYAESSIQKVSDFRASVNAFKGAIGNLIQAPADLATEINGLFEDVTNLFDAPEDLLGSFRSLFSFGDDDPIVKSNTVGRVQRNTNRELVRASIKTQALGYAYVNATATTYNTTEELDRVQDTLEEQYLDIRNNQKMSNEALEILDQVRVQAQLSLDDVRVNTRSIITISTREVPLSVLVYRYYGSTELTEVIADLNNINQNAFVSGDVRILSE